MEKYTAEELIKCMEYLFECLRAEWSGIADPELMEYRLKADAIILIIKDQLKAPGLK